jgi:hypothetical protein
LDDFNRFDAGLCDAAEIAFVPDLRAGARRVFAGFVFAEALVFPGIWLPEADLDDFFRDFLDIRLPFVAFGRSTKAVLQLQLSSGAREASPWLGKSDGAEVWLQGIPRTTPLLVERAPGAK